MTAYLPPNLLALFAPRDPLPFKEPPTKETHERKKIPLNGVAEYVKHFEISDEKAPELKTLTREERRAEKKRERAEYHAYRIEKGIAEWNPHKNPRATSDPYKTLFVSNINYETSESKLARNFEQFGRVKRVRKVYDETGDVRKPRGYAFIEFERERDMHAAYKRGDGMKIDNRRVSVDVERGRTVKGWLPRRFGGGVGEGRRARSPGRKSSTASHSSASSRYAERRSSWQRSPVRR